eukprot:6207920-Pleurochrysis_carterae.AAC.1
MAESRAERRGAETESGRAASGAPSQGGASTEAHAGESESSCIRSCTPFGPFDSLGCVGLMLASAANRSLTADELLSCVCFEDWPENSITPVFVVNLLQSYSHIERRRFLLFVTGRVQIPISPLPHLPESARPPLVVRFSADTGPRPQPVVSAWELMLGEADSEPQLRVLFAQALGLRIG